jgi:dienelactone hydrolase
MRARVVLRAGSAAVARLAAARLAVGRSAAAAVAVAAGAFALPAAAPANGDGLEVEFAATDGLTLKGTYYEAPAPGPGLLLLHQCNRDRHSWDAAARVLVDAGLHVLTMDFRGFGGSVGRNVRSFPDQHEELWPMFDVDVDRALEFLAALPGVDGARLGAMGASCGGSQALLLASRSENVRALVFLSSSLPMISEEDIVLFERNRDVPLFAIAAEGDEGAAAAARRLFDRSRSGGSRFLLYKGHEHGVPLFERDPALVTEIVAFFLANL